MASRKKHKHTFGDVVGLNDKFRQNADIANKLGEFFGLDRTERREIQGVVRRKDGVKYMFEGGREFPIAWFDEGRVVNWEKLIFYLLVPLAAAIISGYVSRGPRDGETLTPSQIQETVDAVVQETMIALSPTATTAPTPSVTPTPNHTATIAAGIAGTLEAFETPSN